MNRKIFSQALAVLMLAGFGLMIIPAQANTPNYGDVDGNGVINSADVTLLRRRVAQGNETGLPNNYNRANADVNGDGVIDANDVTLLRRHVAATDPSTVRLGPKPPAYFVSITSDDGPHETHTVSMLDNLQTLNRRAEVICGRNGIEACHAGIGCGTVCGTVSRAVISFYVLGGDGVAGHWTFTTPLETSRAMMRRMLAEGHSVENHTWSHLISHTHGREHIVNNEIARTNDIIRAALHGQSPITDFYGNTWSNSNPYPIFSFRPNNFTMGAAFRHADTDTGQPWIFAGLDVDDWRGHSPQQMRDFMINGANANRCPPGTSCAGGCNIWQGWSSYEGVVDGGADGGIILIHDNASAGARAAQFISLVVPPMQNLNYHFVTIEQMFDYMDAEWAWVNDVANIRPGEGNGTRVNDWVIKGARRTGSAPRPHTRP
jgi:peptidoglycan/xylan/chitin deacetylase (PgdA/CDA1 family)